MNREIITALVTGANRVGHFSYPLSPECPWLPLDCAGNLARTLCPPCSLGFGWVIQGIHVPSDTSLDTHVGQRR
jgi:hypothetical protein